MKSKIIIAGLILCLLLLTSGLVLALAGERIDRFAVSNGGGQVEAQGLQLKSAIGQPVAGAVSIGPNTVGLCSGLICGQADFPTPTPPKPTATPTETPVGSTVTPTPTAPVNTDGVLLPFIFVAGPADG